MGKKITLIGAGSVVFTRGLVADMIRTFSGEGWRLALVDIDPAALSIVSKICRKMIETKKSDLQLTESTDRRDVLPGSDYVVTTIGVGGRRAWEKDVYIPRKYGVFQPVGDSVMPGGISRAMRMVPAMLGIVRDVEKLCPGARLFNYSNPMAMICGAVRKATGFPIVGLCHGVTHTESYIAGFAGLDRQKFTTYAVGLNHLTFIYDFRYDGRDALPIIKDKLAEIKKNGVDYTNAGRGFAEMEMDAPQLDEPFSWELFERYKAFPAPGDRHVTEFYADRFISPGSYYGKTLGVDAFSFEQTIESGDTGYANMVDLAESAGSLPNSFFDRFSGEHEQVMDIIYSIEHDWRKVFYANLPNRGAVSNLPEQAVLELPAVATSAGIVPINVNGFPDTLAAIINRHLAIAAVATEAALTGDRELFVEAVLLGGYITGREAVSAMVNELIETHNEYLPQFK